MTERKATTKARTHWSKMAAGYPEGVLVFDYNNHPGDTLTADIIREALASGWKHPDAADVIQTFDEEDRGNSVWAETEGLSEDMYAINNQAIDWMSEKLAPEGYCFTMDGEAEGFFLVKIDDDEPESETAKPEPDVQVTATANGAVVTVTDAESGEQTVGIIPNPATEDDSTE